MKKQKMLLVLPVPFRFEGGQLFFEFQACNGLERWADNFGTVIVAAPLMPEGLVEQHKTISWKDTATLANPERFELVPLPWAYSLQHFLPSYRSTRKVLAELISRSHYLQFGLFGLVGDWGAVAALEAQKQGRLYAIHMDRVEHKSVLKMVKGSQLKIWLKALVTATLLKWYHGWIIKRSNLGLWHGADCYSAYSSLCPNSYLIHNVHTKTSDLISDLALTDKAKSCLNESIIRVCYAGQMSLAKAPLDWIQAIAVARDLGVNLHATWIGDGVLRSEMEAMISALKLDSHIELAGFECERATVLKKIRAAHVMLFTHITPESPRCLIEALINGTSILGYHSHYPVDLVHNSIAGKFVPVGEWKQLGELLNTLAQNREQLAQMIQDAATCGRRFNDEAVFLERSELIKKHLQPVGTGIPKNWGSLMPDN